MGIFKKLTQATIRTVTTPISVAADIITLGGINTDQDEPYTVQKLKKIKDNLEGAKEDWDSFMDD